MPMIQTPRWAACSSLENDTTLAPPWPTRGASAGIPVRTAYVIMAAVAESVADGTVYEQDPARADAVPRRGPSVDDPHDRDQND